MRCAKGFIELYSEVKNSKNRDPIHFNLHLFSILFFLDFFVFTLMEKSQVISLCELHPLAHLPKAKRTFLILAGVKILFTLNYISLKIIPVINCLFVIQILINSCRVLRNLFLIILWDNLTK